MKNLIYFSLILCIGCRKDTVATISEIIPFENNDIKLQFTSSTVPGYVKDISFFTASTGIAITYAGEIYRTTNSGNTWDLKYSNPIADQPFSQLLFTSDNIGYVVGGSTNCTGNNCIPPGGVILKTTDGGNTWTRIFQMQNVEFVSIASNISGDLFVLSNGTKGSILKSTDAGNSWTVGYTADFHLQKISFSNNFGYCTGMYGNILRSNNDGDTWKLITTITALYGTDIKFNGDSGFCIVNNALVYTSVDNGTNWTQSLTSDGSFVINSISPSIYLVFGAGQYSGGDWGISYGALRETKNSGADWTVMQFTNIESIRCTSFYSASEGYAVSNNYLIKITVK